MSINYSNFNLARGFKRSYLVLSIIWFSLFFYLAIGEIKPQIKSEVIDKNHDCDYVLERKFFTQVSESYDLYKNAKNKENFLGFTEDKGRPCLAFFELSFIQRLNTQSFYSLSVLSVIPLPLFYILFFIISGFRRDKDN